VAGVVGAIAPDIDLLYFHLIDHRQTLHHRYFSHWPLTWLVLTVAAVALNRRTARSAQSPRGLKGTAALSAARRLRAIFFLVLLFCLGGTLHIILDSIVGDVFWFAPFIYKPWSLFAVHGNLHPWWLNFVAHWSFGLEIAICLWAVVLRRSNEERGMPPLLP
jgi:inner membrane protein